MNLRRHKGRLAAGAVIIALLLVVMVWLSSPSQSGVRLTFLYATNHLQIGRRGMFELVNHLNESVSADYAHYKLAGRSGLNAQLGDRGATLGGRHTFAAGTTNTFLVWTPADGGPYKLVLQCLSASKDTSRFLGSARARLVSFISPWVKPSFTTKARWYGSVFAESQSFEATP